MKDLYREIGVIIETLCEKENIDVITEFVDDVDARVTEIINDLSIEATDVYEGSQSTGAFIPSIGDSPAHIIVQMVQPNYMYIKTAFHELQHLVDYVRFSNCLLKADIPQKEESRLRVTFNVYSEFSASYSGVKCYCETLTTALCFDGTKIFNVISYDSVSSYLDFSGIKNDYQFLIHSIQFLGVQRALADVFNCADLNDVINKMERSLELIPVFNKLFNFENQIEWYVEFDKLARKFVG